MRERWKQDFLAAIILKKKHAGSFWVEQFSREHEGDSAAKIRADVASLRDRVGNVFDFVYSTSIGEQKDEASAFVLLRLREMAYKHGWRK